MGCSPIKVFAKHSLLHIQASYRPSETRYPREKSVKGRNKGSEDLLARVRFESIKIDWPL